MDDVFTPEPVVMVTQETANEEQGGMIEALAPLSQSQHLSAGRQPLHRLSVVMATRRFVLPPLTRAALAVKLREQPCTRNRNEQLGRVHVWILQVT